ncbi:MAG: UbiX family flavin prenyltransferase [Pantoea sp. Brub]|nr:UbiX family flavin prenyltransferase [Pantoea sp. Brub]
MKRRIVIGISGASGVIYSVRMLEILKRIQTIETHLVISKSSYKTLQIESKLNINKMSTLCDTAYHINDIAASISSGSFKTIGMIILPCSIKTLSGVVHSYADSLLIRAADVTLKEQRKLVLCLRETPLHVGHLRMMINAAKLGAIIMPIIPTFYHYPKSINDIIDHMIYRIIDQFDIEIPNNLFKRWHGKYTKL